MRRGQKGFTLIETLAAVAVAGMIMTAGVALISHEVRGTGVARVTVTASHETGTAGRWISQDAMMAESSDLVDGAAAVDRVTLTWTEWFQLANVPHESTYWLSGSELKRDFDGTVSTVARNISGVGFSQADRVITLVITSTPKWSFTRSVERTFRVGLRPKG